MEAKPAQSSNIFSDEYTRKKPNSRRNEQRKTETKYSGDADFMCGTQDQSKFSTKIALSSRKNTKRPSKQKAIFFKDFFGVACSVCLGPMEEDERLVACCDTKIHPPLHWDCLSNHLNHSVDDMHVGKCVPIYCPVPHDSKRVILPYSSYEHIISRESNLKYTYYADSLFELICSSCHSSRSWRITPNQETPKNLSKYQANMNALFNALDDFEMGLIDVITLHDNIIPGIFPSLQHSNYRTREYFTRWQDVISLLKSPERIASLQLHHYIRYPAVYSPCCTALHCFNCKTRDTHEGRTCKKMEKRTVNDVLSCSHCGAFLTKSEGCNSITCVCGRTILWKSELKAYQKKNSLHNKLGFHADRDTILVLYGVKPPSGGNDKRMYELWMSKQGRDMVTIYMKVLSDAVGRRNVAAVIARANRYDAIAQDFQDQYRNEFVRVSSEIRLARESLFQSFYESNDQMRKILIETRNIDIFGLSKQERKSHRSSCDTLEVGSIEKHLFSILYKCGNNPMRGLVKVVRGQMYWRFFEESDHARVNLVVQRLPEIYNLLQMRHNSCTNIERELAVDWSTRWAWRYEKKVPEKDRQKLLIQSYLLFFDMRCASDLFKSEEKVVLRYSFPFVLAAAIHQRVYGDPSMFSGQETNSSQNNFRLNFNVQMKREVSDTQPEPCISDFDDLTLNSLSVETRKIPLRDYVGSPRVRSREYLEYDPDSSDEDND